MLVFSSVRNGSRLDTVGNPTPSTPDRLSDLSPAIALASAKLFANLGLPITTIDDLLLDVKVERFQTDEIIIKKGEVDDGHMFIIKQGTLAVDTGEGKEIFLKTQVGTRHTPLTKLRLPKEDSRRY